MLRSAIFFPVLVSTVAVGITFAVLMHPSTGLINRSLEVVGIDGPQWLSDPNIALLSVAFVDVWKGIGIALVIFIAGILSIPEDYFDTARLEGGAWVQVPTRDRAAQPERDVHGDPALVHRRPAVVRPDLDDDPRRPGVQPRDVIASTIYKQYQAGFYGLATAGNVILFIAVTIIVFPMMRFFNRHEIEL